MARKDGYRVYPKKQAVYATANAFAGRSSRSNERQVRFIADHGCFKVGDVAYLDWQNAKWAILNGIAKAI